MTTTTMRNLIPVSYGDLVVNPSASVSLSAFIFHIVFNFRFL